MSIKYLFEKVGIKGLSINPGFMNIEFDLSSPDRDAAWDMYVELITRISTQKMQYGQEKEALNSLFGLFGTTREIIKKHGRSCIHFAKVAVIVLNQVIRPFTSKWHEIAVTKKFEEEEVRAKFREEIAKVQENMRKYTAILAEMAGVEDITDLEEV